jgi:SH3 domain-containing protein
MPFVDRDSYLKGRAGIFGSTDGKPYDHFSWSKGREDRLEAFEASNPWKKSDNSSSSWSWNSKSSTSGASNSSAGAGVLGLIAVALIWGALSGGNDGTTKSKEGLGQPVQQETLNVEGAPAAEHVNPEGAADQAAEMIVTGTHVNLRSAPNASDNSNVIEKLDRGEMVQVIEPRNDGWVEIKTSLGGKSLHGFISAKFLATYDESGAVNPPNNIGMQIAVGCQYATAYIAPNRQEWDGHSTLGLHRGDVLSQAQPYTQPKTDDHFFKATSGNATVFVRQSDIVGTECDDQEAGR